MVTVVWPVAMPDAAKSSAMAVDCCMLAPSFW